MASLRTAHPSSETALGSEPGVATPGPKREYRAAVGVRLDPALLRGAHCAYGDRSHRRSVRPRRWLGSLAFGAHASKNTVSPSPCKRMSNRHTSPPGVSSRFAIKVPRRSAGTLSSTGSDSSLK